MVKHFEFQHLPNGMFHQQNWCNFQRKFTQSQQQLNSFKLIKHNIHH